MAISVTTPTALVQGTPASGVDLTSGSFTPADGSLLVAVGTRRDLGGIVGSSVSGGGLTWTLAKAAGSADTTKPGYVAIFTAPVVTGASMTVSFQVDAGGGGGTSTTLSVYQVTGQHATPVGATGSGAITTQPVDIPLYTSTATGSRAIWGVAEDNAVTGVTSSDSTVQSHEFSGVQTHASGFLAANSGAPGAITANWQSSSNPAGTWVGVEIVPSAGIAGSPAHLYAQMVAN